MLVYVAIVIEMFCVYLELDMDMNIDVVPINVEDNIIEYCMGNVETEVVPEGGTSRNANQNEEHDILDVDLDMDYDM